MPVIEPVHSFFYSERQIRLTLWHGLKQFAYYEPLFKSRCEKAGKGLKILVGMPQILGDLRIVVGKNVILHGASTFLGSKVFESPKLSIGDDTHLGYQVGIFVGRDVKIGSHVLIGNRVEIYSYDLHPVNMADRLLGRPAPAESSKPVIIGDNVWICSNSTILKGVRIGESSVVANGSVVTKNVPPNSIVGGNPARVLRMLKE